MSEFLTKVKANLILEHSADDALIDRFITAAVSYAESYQHIAEGYYSENTMPATTEQAVIMLSSHFYESGDGSTGGFFADNMQAGQLVWNTVNLRLDQDWKNTGDTFVYGDYEYRYNCWNDIGSWAQGTTDEWAVVVLDNSKTEYGAILESINGQYTTSFYGTFRDCTNLITAPAIPNSVTNMETTFSNCISLKTAPVIPNSVIDMDYAFMNCTSLTTAPVIPSSVIDMPQAFYNCSKLTGNIEINASPRDYVYCLSGTQITSISGDCAEATKTAILATK